MLMLQELQYYDQNRSKPPYSLQTLTDELIAKLLCCTVLGVKLIQHPAKWRHLVIAMPGLDNTPYAGNDSTV